MMDPISAHEFLIRNDPSSGMGARKAGGGDEEGGGFGEVLKELVKETDELQKSADKTLEGFADGTVEDVHEVMMSMNKADLSFRMLLEIRNKLVDAYTEVMRTQV